MVQENEVIQSTKLASKKQKIILTITVVIIVGVTFIFLTSGKKKEGDEISDIINGSEKIVLQDVNKGIKAEDRWLYEAQGKLEDFDQFMQESDQSKSGFESRLSAIEEKYQQDISNQTDVIESQSAEIENLKNQLKDLQSNKNLAFNPSSAPANLALDQQNFQSQPVDKTISSLEVKLEESRAKSRKKGLYNINDYIPAGAYAKATIISGVDASVGISSQSDPRPILLRVKGPAISSIYDGDVQKSDIAGCLITGAASGDLSSEKVYVKLVTMTCGKDEDMITEIPVKGYVAGQGKSGIRGHVISREGDLIAKTFIAGLVSGFGQGLSEKVAPPLNFSNGLTTQGTLSSEDVAKKGLGKGVATSSERLANYLINRAEQYQPVVSIPSGLDVEVVFVEGFYVNSQDKSQSKNNSPNVN